jgi:hypothetical protein
MFIKPKINNSFKEQKRYDPPRGYTNTGEKKKIFVAVPNKLLLPGLLVLFLPQLRLTADIPVGTGTYLSIPIVLTGNYINAVNILPSRFCLISRLS